MILPPGFEWGQLISAGDNNITTVKKGVPLLVAMNSYGAMSPIGSAFIIAVHGYYAIALTASHNFAGIKNAQNPIKRHHSTALPEFLGNKQEISLDKRKVRAVCFEGDSADNGEAAIIERAFVDKESDIAILILTVEDKENNNDYFINCMGIDDRFPEVGDTVGVIGHMNMRIESETVEENDGRISKMSAQILCRIGRITNVYPDGHILTRGACVETSIPVFPGMSGGPVFIMPKKGQLIYAFGVVSSDPENENIDKYDQKTRGHSIISLIQSEVGLDSKGERKTTIKLRPESFLKNDKAITKHQVAVEWQWGIDEAYCAWGRDLATSGKYNEAIAKFQKAVKCQPDSADAYFNWGVVLNRIDRNEDALAKYKEAVKYQPDNVKAYNNWGASLSFLGRYDEALAKYQEAVKCQPDYAEAYNNWGGALSKLDRDDEALTKFQEAVKYKPDYAEAYYNWGLLLSKSDRYDEAITKFREAVKHQPDYANAYCNWGLVLFRIGRHEDAIAKHQEAVKHQPDYAEAYSNWGSSLSTLGWYDEAFTKFQKAVKYKPDFAEAYYNWGLALGKSGRDDEAITKYQKVVKYKPDYAEAYYNWGISLHKLKKIGKAKVKFIKAQELGYYLHPEIQKIIA